MYASRKHLVSVEFICGLHNNQPAYFASDDILLGLNIIHRFTFATISSAFFSVDSFFVLRYESRVNVLVASVKVY